ncbi:MAG: glycosyltransferase family 8 protein [Limnothrix sp.]
MKSEVLTGEKIESTAMDPNNESIVIVCSSDNNYPMQLAVTIRSAIENLGKNRKILLFVIDGDIKEQNKRRFLSSINPEYCEVKWIPKPHAIINKNVIPERITSGVPEIAHITIATWYRLLISKLLPQSYKKAIYLDCDLVVTGDLGELWDIDIKDNYLLAVARLESYEYRTVPYFLRNWKELGLSKGDKYFNAGVLVFNLEKWRSDDMGNKALNYIKQNLEYIKYGDQDVLNAIVAGHWAELDPRWNCMNAPSMTQEEVDDSFIIHFATLPKPWVTLDEFPSKDAFYKYLSLTSWSDYKYSILRRVYTTSKQIKQKIKRKYKRSFSSH